MRVDFLCQWYPPEPARVPLAIVRGLRSLGHEVRVVTGAPNYPTGVVAEGYSAWRYRREETPEGVVVTCPLYPSHDASAPRRVANYASFAASSLPALLTGPRADVTLVYSSPGTVNLTALAHRAARGVPVVTLVEDLWPDSVLATGMLDRLPRGELVERALHAVFDASYRWSDAVVVTSPGMADALAARGVPAERLSTVYNWQDRDEVGHYLRAEHDESDTLRLVYGGNLGPAQGLATAVRAVGRLTGRVHLTLVGEGTEREELERLAAEVAPGAVTFRERMSADAFEELAATYDASLVSLAPDPLFEMTLPGKLPATLALGCPVVLSASGDIRRIVDGAGAGWSAPAGDVEGLVAALEQAHAAGAAGRRRAAERAFAFYSDHMAPETGARTLEKVLAAASGKEAS